MGYWFLCKETPPGSGNFPPVDFIATSPDVGSAWLQGGYAVFDDGFPSDFSGWGPEEADSIVSYIWKLSQADNGVSYACMYAGADFVPDQGGGGGEGLMAAQRTGAATKPPIFIMVQSSKTHKKPKPPKPHKP